VTICWLSYAGITFSLVNVTACDPMILEHCAVLDPDVFLPKTVLLPKDGDLSSSSEIDCARVRRWWAMMAAFSVSHVVHDDAEDTANTTPIGDDDED
jgi:hypothetical protein